MLSCPPPPNPRIRLKCVCCLTQSTLEEDTKERTGALQRKILPPLPTPPHPQSHLWMDLRNEDICIISLSRAEAELSPLT